MSRADAEALRAIRTFPSLVKYLRDELDWPISTDDFDEMVFDYEPEELGLDLKTAAKVDRIRQLRPLVTGQPWGIFFITFEPKSLPVVALRRILGHLVLKQRQSAKKAHQQTWQLNDLLFISSYGETEHRDITFAHFADEGHGRQLPTLKVLGWDDEDTLHHLGHAHEMLVEKLHWPDDQEDVDSWRARWSTAFELRHREAITTAKELAQQLARLATVVRKRVNHIVAHETERGPMRRLMKAFHEGLIHDLTEDDFADTYAQTIAYGLLTEKLAAPEGSKKEIRLANPFLRELLDQCRKVGRRHHLMDFDELGVGEIEELLNSPDTNFAAVRRDFNDKNPLEDPVIHFYELFLKEYDPKKRTQRGVFYTPRPVVSYIVRSVDEILKKEFGLKDGLADTATWADMVIRQKGLKIPDGTTPNSPFVTILDPACGTGTFLVEVIDQIHKNLWEKWKREKRGLLEYEQLWNEYIPKHLLPRLYGFELMMAPYAIAHMKIGLKLAETGYKFGSDERARIYLANSLEPSRDVVRQIDVYAPALAHEAMTVNEIKGKQKFTVVIGNPPYSGISSNMSEYAQRIVDAYRSVDGIALNEKKVWLQDDYVKFIRKAQTIIEISGVGVLGYITNHGYLDNSTFRGMRQSLMGTFPCLRVLDLHGNANKKEQSPDGSEDKNVFDIRQGVAVCLATRGGANAVVEHGELWGSRESKYLWLAEHDVRNSKFSALKPESPYYFFETQRSKTDPAYESATPISEIFSLSNSGIVTARDGLVLDLDLLVLRKRIAEFRNTKLSDAEITARFDLSENYMWRVHDARKQLMAVKDCESLFTEVLYRPFNTRHIFFHPSVVWRPRMDVMCQMRHKNLALITTRQTQDLFGALATRFIAGHKAVAAYDINSVFPLYTYPESRGQRDYLASSERVPNIAAGFLKAVAATLNVPQKGTHGLPAGLTPEDIFHYTYAVFHSPGYRSRYAEFLKTDFPRLPLTGSLELFHALARLGGELVAIHLMESPKVDHFITTYTGPKNPEVGRVGWSNDTVWLDASATKKGQPATPGTIGFRGVREAVWNFYIGGYQVCEKWLKDRKGRTLTKDDIEHYQRIVVALNETIRLMAEIDKVIEAHGGWPGAFTAGKPAE